MLIKFAGGTAPPSVSDSHVVLRTYPHAYATALDKAAHRPVTTTIPGDEVTRSDKSSIAVTVDLMACE